MRGTSLNFLIQQELTFTFKTIKQISYNGIVENKIDYIAVKIQ